MQKEDKINLIASMLFDEGFGPCSRLAAERYAKKIVETLEADEEEMKRTEMIKESVKKVWQQG